ncbi:ABC transporter permease [Streptomyces avidinii]|uniref:Transport permease protein n=1 Tax=Streptomyces avidinii TaxID=1895 RepID=A0ABS4L786_STRAV|nr:ABC transporter permease [Streptomyces avidinii]MBP2037947.1 ABC-2 type transport system permease protein/oleandomycin transport system permease protein [Streptomyces avidinii]GGZ07430.1 transport permease protein [Streptomyces avidinii]
MTGTTLTDSLGRGGRVRPLPALRQTATMAWRSLVSVKHNPLELVDYSITPIMFVFLFTYVFGGQMAGSPQEYLQYALAGIIVQNTLFMSMYTAMSLNTDLTKGVFDRLRSLPIARSAPLFGRIAADLAKQLWAMLLMIALGVVLGFEITGGPPGFIGAALLLLTFAAAVSWTAVLIGMVAGDPEKVQVYAFTFIFPLTFTSSAFVEVDTMPGWLQAWVEVNPVTHLSDAFRGLLLGTPAGGPILWSLLWAAGITAVFMPLALRAYRSESH